MANVKGFTEKPIGQKLHASDLWMQGHKKTSGNQQMCALTTAI